VYDGEALVVKYTNREKKSEFDSILPVLALLLDQNLSISKGDAVFHAFFFPFLDSLLGTLKLDALSGPLHS